MYYFFIQLDLLAKFPEIPINPFVVRQKALAEMTNN